MADQPLLEVDAVTTGYGHVRALDGVRLHVPEGAVVALLGANGAGKSTLLRTVSGLVRPWSGRVVLDGDDLRRVSADEIARRGVAHVPEGRALFPDMSVAENLRLGCQGLDDDATAAAVGRAEELFPVLGERRTQRAGTLSGGQQQMLAIARSLCKQPRLLLLDEMSQGLAPIIVEELFARIPSIRDSGTTILLVEQFASSALQVADVVHVMEKGRITFSGTPSELLGDPDAVREAYLGGGESARRHRNGEADRPTEEVIIRIAPATRRAYEALARANGTSVGDEVRAALAAHLAAKPRQRRRPLTTPTAARATGGSDGS